MNISSKDTSPNNSSKMEAQNLSVWFGEKQVLFDVCLPIQKNTITAIIGASGCGKSTALRSFNDMNREISGCRQTGDILLDGLDVEGHHLPTTELRRRVGMVFQRPNPFPSSIRANLLFAPRLHGLIKGGSKCAEDARVAACLQKAGLWDEVKDDLKRSGTSLSGGQQQRLCIARALSADPEVLLLDEPCSSLDPNATARIEDLLLSMRNEYTIVIVTHNLAQARRIADKTAFFHMGRLVEMSVTEELFTSPSKEYTRDYVTGRFG